MGVEAVSPMACARRAKGLSQGEAAQLLGVSKTTVWVYERPDAKIPSDKLIACSQIYDCDVGYLLGLQLEPKKV